MTEMQKFAMALIAENIGGVRPGVLSRMWRNHKGQNQGCDSRSQFGATAATYRCLRTLAKNGHVIMRILAVIGQTKFFTL
jgi:hypothetical protein